MTVHNEALRDHACLIVHGPDKPGIVAAVTALITRSKGNIVQLDQYSDDANGGNFFQRVVFHRPDLAAAMPEIEADLAATVTPLGLEWTLTDQSVPKRMAILASTSDHCLLELLWRHRRGELPVTIPMVISNHTNTAEDVRSFGIPFFHVPSQGPDKSAAEARILELVKGNVDFIVLARYMQIISEDFLDEVGVPVINIHHSFLPAFIGAAPVPQGERTRREAHRRDLALRHEGPRRGPDHRAGRRPREPRDGCRRPAVPRRLRRARRALPRRAVARPGPRHPARQPDHRLHGPTVSTTDAST